jgi:glycosyltransferase involved in cell wall biosynthesis
MPNLVPLLGMRRDIDVVHSCQNLLLTRRPWLVDLEHGQPFVGSDFNRLDNPVTRGIILSLLASDRCRAILPWTETAARAFTATFNPDAAIVAKMRVVAPAIRAPRIDPVERNSTRCRLLFVANRPEYNVLLKGGRELLKAFRILRQRFTRVSLTIVGPVQPDVAAAARDIPGVLFTGTVPRAELETIYREADIYVMPTASDTFGMVFLEAMAHALPVVALNRPFTRDIVRHGETGLLVNVPASAIQWCADDGRLTMNSEVLIAAVLNAPPDETLIENLVDVLTMLIEDVPLRRKLGAAARDEIISGKFSILRRNQALRDIYLQAMCS